MTSRSAWLALSLTIVSLVAPGLASAADAARGAKLGLHLPGLPRHPELQEHLSRVQRAEAGRAARGATSSPRSRNTRARTARTRRCTRTRSTHVRTGHAGHGGVPGGQQLKPTARPSAPRRRRRRPASPATARRRRHPAGVPEPRRPARRLHAEVAASAYRSGQRKNPVMGGMAATLTDAGHPRTCALLLEPAPRPVRHRRDPRSRASARRCKRAASSRSTRRPGEPRPSCFRVARHRTLGGQPRAAA